MVILPQFSVFSVQGVAKGKILSAERQVYRTPAAPSAGMSVEHSSPTCDSHQNRRAGTNSQMARRVLRTIRILPAELNEAKSVYYFAAAASFQTMTSVTPLRALPLLVKTMRNLSLVTGAKAAEFH